jgi:hypothetical protein
MEDVMFLEMSRLSKDQKRRKMLQRWQKKQQKKQQKTKLIRGVQAVQKMNQERQSALEGWEPLKLIKIADDDFDNFKNLENAGGHPWPVIKASRWVNREWECWLLEGDTDLHILITHFSGTSVTPWHDWVIFQQIKNELVGTEQEMVELYPAESRLLNSSHMYHLWGKKGGIIRIGFLPSQEDCVAMAKLKAGASNEPAS